MGADFVGGNHRGEPRRLAVAPCLIILALTLAGLHGAATPALGAAEQKPAAAAKPSTAPAETWEGFWAMGNKKGGLVILGLREIFSPFGFY